MNPSFLKIFSSLICVLLCCLPVSLTAASANDFEIPDGLVWFNSDRPLKLSDLKGKFVLVYFWNYGGMNLQALFDQYKELQEKFPNELILIGIHSGKEVDTDRLNSRVAEEIGIRKIPSPVAVDPYMRAIKAFRQDRWPAAVLFAPDGSRLLTHTGERDVFLVISRLITKKIPMYKGSLVDVPMVFQTPEKIPPEQGPKETPVIMDDLADKALGKGLMGQTALELPEDSAVIETVLEFPEESQAIKTKPSESYHHNELDRGMTHVYDQVDFDEKSFTGQIIVIDREYSNKISAISLDVRLPKHAKWQAPGQSYVRVFTANREVLFQGLILHPQMDLLINRHVTSQHLYVELMIYFTVDSHKTLYVMRPLVFKIPLVDDPKHETIQILHQIPSER